MNLKALLIKQLKNNRCNISSKLFEDLSESFIDKLYGYYNGFSKFRGYCVGACDGSIFDLPNHPTTQKKTFNISVNDIFKRHLSRGHVSCILDVHF